MKGSLNYRYRSPARIIYDSESGLDSQFWGLFSWHQYYVRTIPFSPIFLIRSIVHTDRYHAWRQCFPSLVPKLTWDLWPMSRLSWILVYDTLCSQLHDYQVGWCNYIPISPWLVIGTKQLVCWPWSQSVNNHSLDQSSLQLLPHGDPCIQRLLFNDRGHLIKARPDWRPVDGPRNVWREQWATLSSPCSTGLPFKEALENSFWPLISEQRSAVYRTGGYHYRWERLNEVTYWSQHTRSWSDTRS